MRFEAERTQLSAWAHKLGADGLCASLPQGEKNLRGIDRSPGLDEPA